MIQLNDSEWERIRDHFPVHRAFAPTGNAGQGIHGGGPESVTIGWRERTGEVGDQRIDDIVGNWHRGQPHSLRETGNRARLKTA